MSYDMDKVLVGYNASFEYPNGYIEKWAIRGLDAGAASDQLLALVASYKQCKATTQAVWVPRNEIDSYPKGASGSRVY